MTRSISLSVGGVDLHLRRLSDRIVDATERDPRLPSLIGGGRWRLTRGVGGRLKTDLRRAGVRLLGGWAFPGTAASTFDRFAGGRESCWLRCSERRLGDGSRRRGTVVAMTDWGRRATAALGIDDLALDLDSISGAFLRGGGLHKRRLPNGVTLGGDGDGDDSGLRCRVTGDDERRLAVKDIS